MLKGDRSGLDYFQLIKTAKRLVPGAGQPLRLALLADVSTQHLVIVLRVLFAQNGVDVEIYEAGYDTVELEAHNPASGLYEFRPQLVAIIQSVQKLKAIYYSFPGDRASVSQVWADRIEGVWNAIQERSHASIAQSTFVLPYERPYGNYGLKVADTLQGAVSELNRGLVLRARRHPSVFMNDIDH